MKDFAHSAPIRSHKARSPLAVGIALLAVGTLLLAINLGYDIPYALWEYWPFALIIPGVASIIVPSRHMSRSGGIWLAATGVYCQIGMTGLFGLGWGSAWPIFIIAAGLSTIFDRRTDERDGPSNA